MTHNCLPPTPTEKDWMGSLSPHFQGPLPSFLGPNPLCWVGESWGSNAYTHLHIEWDTQMFNAKIPIIVFGLNPQRYYNTLSITKTPRQMLNLLLQISVKDLFSQRHWLLKRKMLKHYHNWQHNLMILSIHQLNWCLPCSLGPICLSYDVLYPISLLTRSDCYINSVS